MSVLIKGMEKPRNCGECQFCHTQLSETWCCIMGREDIFFDDIPDWCPLVEVKAPHGRLVDADKIKATYGEWYTEEGTEEGFIGTIANLVDSIPAVIEEEDDDEEIQGCNEDGCPIFFGESSDEPAEGAEE